MLNNICLFIIIIFILLIIYNYVETYEYFNYNTDTTMSPQCSCQPGGASSQPYINKSPQFSTCEKLLDNFTNLYSQRGKFHPYTKFNFLGWCDSYKNSMNMFPKYEEARDKFVLFNDENLSTDPYLDDIGANNVNIENFGDAHLYTNRNDICGVYIDAFANSYGDITEQTQYNFYKWCEGYKNVTQSYPDYRTAERIFEKLINLSNRNF